ncbi:hypothetical protein [Halotia branconii]|uniref:Uncharacterized protein n=1 Tax=Halotia branconii CENA392 TaxID=1539056 RepID=A0AAJ6NQL0_9CYAN|nr:hypothetical protein [Halotia branconii]WGV24785.1 hypothetical protein QI031_23925 [Halotia branconii CENA392]
MTTEAEKIWRHAKELQQAAELLVICCQAHPQELDYLRFNFEAVTSQYTQLEKLFSGDSQ